MSLKEILFSTFIFFYTYSKFLLTFQGRKLKKSQKARKKIHYYFILKFIKLFYLENLKNLFLLTNNLLKGSYCSSSILIPWKYEKNIVYTFLWLKSFIITIEYFLFLCFIINFTFSDLFVCLLIYFLLSCISYRKIIFWRTYHIFQYL